MTGLCVAYELSNFMYLFLWLAAEGSKCTRGHILLLLIAFRLNEKEFLAYCPLFMKWKEITSCIISVYIIRFILFLTFLSWVSPSCSRCREWVLLLYFVTDRCEVEERVWEVEGEGLGKKPPPSEAAAAAALNTVWFLSFRSFAQQPNPDSRCSIPSSVCEHRNEESLLFFLPCQEFLGGECQ